MVFDGLQNYRNCSVIWLPNCYLLRIELELYWLQNACIGQPGSLHRFVENNSDLIFLFCSKQTDWGDRSPTPYPIIFLAGFLIQPLQYIYLICTGYFKSLNIYFLFRVQLNSNKKLHILQHIQWNTKNTLLKKQCITKTLRSLNSERNTSKNTHRT
jgi:hypothetical protein